MRPYENLFRPAYEVYASGTWLAAMLCMTWVALFTSLPSAPFMFMAAISVVLGARTGYQTYRLWCFRLNLAGKPPAFMKTAELLARTRESHLWLGLGFDWSPVHTQRALEIRKRDLASVLPPSWFLALRGAAGHAATVGSPWIHGLETDEREVYQPLHSLEGHTVVFGTTRSGKTRLLEILIFQAVMRGEVVLIIDPKGDRELREVTQRACVLAGRADAFVEFHPAFPSRSVRLDPLRNWNRPTEIASRIAALMPTGPGSEAFTGFAWGAINAVAEGLIYIDQMPNLAKLRTFIEGGPDALLEQVFRTFFGRRVPGWEAAIASLAEQARSGRLKGRFPPTASAELMAYIHFYRREVSEHLREPEVDALLAMVEHSRDHLGKILASLSPLLVMLTAGELGKMLSPDPTDFADVRPLTDTKKLIRGGNVLYMGLDSLSDATVGSAVGSIVLADLAAVAGERFNYCDADDLTKIQLFVDEAAEIVNPPLIQLLNKGGGAGIVATLLSQTVADLVVRTGSEARALQILGNCNNLIALRSKDGRTQEFIVEAFGRTEVQVLTRTQSAGTRTEDHGLDYGAHVSESLAERATEVFPPELLGMLPNLHYVALLAGGRLVKGRIPKLRDG